MKQTSRWVTDESLILLIFASYVAWSIEIPCYTRNNSSIKNNTLLLYGRGSIHFTYF